MIDCREGKPYDLHQTNFPCWCPHSFPHLDWPAAGSGTQLPAFSSGIVAATPLLIFSGIKFSAVRSIEHDIYPTGSHLLSTAIDIQTILWSIRL